MLVHLPNHEVAMSKAVIFDIDGTLIDSVDGHAHAWQRTLARYGCDVPFEKVRSQIGKGGDQLMPALLPEAIIREKGKEIERVRLDMFKHEYLPQVRPFPEVRALVKRLLADGKRVVLASSAKGDELETYKRIAGIDDLIEDATSSEDADRSKPHPDIFQAALAKLEGLDASDAVVIGDTPYDAEAAGKAGLRTIGVLCGGFAEQDLRRAGCSAIFRDPADLLRNLDTAPL
jgi:HAD superfamily hydrolase (TIGR01509 family)